MGCEEQAGWRGKKGMEDGGDSGVSEGKGGKKDDES